MSELDPRIPLTPMLSQYLEIKRRYPDAILFFRMGDFYEMFLEDATKAAPILEVQLTSRDKNSTHPIPMCGIPHHAAQSYLQKLIQRGLKVAICEQVEDPAAHKGIVRREVVRVVTPALIGDPDLVPADSTHYLLCLSFAQTPSPSIELQASLYDLFSNQLRVGKIETEKQFFELFYQYQPREVLIAKEFEDHQWLREVKKLFPQLLITCRENPTLEDYLRETQKIEGPISTQREPLFHPDTVQIDVTTLSSLEILKGVGTPLCEVLDHTCTPMGRRMLREWLVRPLSQKKKIEARLQAVEALIEEPQASQSLRTALGKIRDLERLATKTSLSLATPRDLVAIRSVLEVIPELKATLAKMKSPLLQQMGTELDSLQELTHEMQLALEDEAPINHRDGGIFRSSFHPELEEYRRLSQDAKQTILQMESDERTRTGIHSLKIKYSRVFGYTIEVSKTHLAKVPSDYIRKQTIANGERYITENLKSFEEKVISAEHRLKTLEESLFFEMRAKVGKQSAVLLHDSRLLGALDVLQSFAEASKRFGYVRPHLANDWDLQITEGRHPVIETLLPAGTFVPNTVHFSHEECRTLILTGPNMAGKSTIMRQVALIVLMAHAGSFVPAASAKIPLTDAIFTRIGSSDDLSRGRSTFMVEMTEVARILEQATEKSLILIDEIGRGTSTYDGLSLAWSLVEFIHQEVKAKTLFATHFHEVTSLEKLLPGVKNANVLVDKWKNEIVFLHKLALGICNQSYGIEVASLAGLPPKVLVRAKDILGHLESQSRRADRSRNRALDPRENQMAFFDDPKSLESQSSIGS